MSGIFRDPTDGAQAKRLDLLRRRRDELVTLPHVVRRVVVARTARIAASIAVCMGGAVLLAAALSPEFANWIAGGLPGQRPAPLSSLLIGTWILGIATYAVARSVAEHRFAVRMSQYVLPGEDLNQDIERLAHEHPDEVAKHMAHRLEVKSASLPVLGAAVLLPVTLMYAFKAIRSFGWPSANDFEAAIALYATPMAATAILGLVTALLLTRRFARLPSVARIAGFVAAVAGLLALVSYVEWTRDQTWMLLAPGFIAAAVAMTVRRLRIERVKIAAVDPAAGSELFTVRGLFRKLRAAVVAVNAALTLDNAKRALRATRTMVTRRPSFRASVIGIGVVAVFAYGAMTLLTDEPADAKARVQLVRSSSGVGVRSPAGEASTWEIRSPSSGQFIVEVTLGDMNEIEIPSMFGVDQIPEGWELSVTVEAYDTDLEAGDEPHAVFVTPVLDPVVAPRQLSNSLRSVDFVVNNCENMEMPLGLRIRPYGPTWKAGDVVKLSVQPSLRLATCALHDID